MKRLSLVVVALLLASFVACGDDAGQNGSDGDSDNGNAAGPATEDCMPGEEVETESGLRIEDIECGDGEEAQGDSAVVVHYVGKLEDGSTFDSSRDRGEPVPFTLGVGQLIPGFEEGIRGMKVGGTRKLTIPPELGYGASGSGPIPPDATLTFEIELLSVEEPSPAGG
jgi:FKBP-type peptidyl-prolyl cis-trans isomerase FkpA